MRREVMVLLWAAVVLCAGAQAARGQTLWAYYPIHENDFKDYSGNNHHGTPVDGPVTVWNAERGWVAAFNQEPALPSRVNCGTEDPAAGGQLTISIWVYWQGPNGNWQGMIGKSFSYDDRSWILQLRDTDGVIQWGGSDRLNEHVWSNAAFTIDEWEHVVGTFDGKTSKVFINGEVVGEAERGFTKGGAAGANVTLGFGEDRSDYDESFNGLLDEIHILTRGVGADQVQDLAKGIVPSFIKARDPYPANGATGVQAPLLRWTAGDGAQVHKVYVGPTPELGAEHLSNPGTALAMHYHVGLLEPGKTYYWRVDEVAKDGTVIEGDVWSFIMQALTAYNPRPVDGEPAASPDTQLTWSPGLGAVQHRLYLGKDLDAVTQGAAAADKGEPADTTFDPNGLEGATTYYWRVDETLAAGGGIKTGPVWSFTTYVVVDGFESYTDEEGNRIYQTWIDGYGDKSSGSTVGYIEAPFAEQKIVHGGGQSMPLDYNNINPPFYSEAKREFDPVQDWTINDVNSLMISFRGRATNGAAPVYVVVQDASNHTAEVVHPDPAIASVAKWTEWSIPLSRLADAGVNLTRVKYLTIGVGDKADTKPGATGLLYVDDLRLVKPATVEPGDVTGP